MKNQNKEEKNPDGVWFRKLLVNILCLQPSQSSRSLSPIWRWRVHADVHAPDAACKCGAFGCL